ncbi:tyrosine-type recombinase/integrase [Brevundimonas sp. LjRoot202]|uniref:tyrosine-type recombinase/integrase n=1 Tax=Brevundimonas sp. LjRoot202 TaxID=3342281 RepID=UPI003ED0F970
MTLLYVLLPFTEARVARAINRLTSRGVAALREPGLHADGQGLYARIDQTGARRWVFIFHLQGRRREMGLGSLEDVGLGEARKAADDARVLLRDGLDPIAKRKADAIPPVSRLFSAVAADLMDTLEPSWRSEKQRGQWEASLQQHAPAIWNADVATVDTEMVLEALKPIWSAKAETATRVRSRIERVLDAAKVRGLRAGENPARWKGHLSALLPKADRNKGHFDAMPYAEVPALITLLAGRQSISALALRFLILTAKRSGEVRGATWDEIKGGVWTIPAERMKGGREHQEPLSAAALAVLERIPSEARKGIIFAGWNGQLSDMSLSKVLRTNGIEGATVHGFRSSFRDWAGDCTTYARETIEEALSHQIGDKAERAYRRSTALEKRRALMAAWADFCTGATGQLINFPERARP